MAILLAVLLAMVAVFGTVASAVIRTRDARIRFLTRQIVPAGLADDDLLTAMINQESGERGYVITGQAGFLDPYTAGSAEAPADMATLRRLLPRDKAVGPALDEIASAITIWRQRTAAPEINDVMSGNSVAAMASVSSGEGKAQFDTVRSKIAALDALLGDRRSSAERSLGHATAVMTDLLFVGLAISMIVIVITAVLVRRWILTPVGSVSKDMRTVVGGLLGHRIVPAGPPEIAALASDADAMRQRILTDLDDTRRAAEALRQHAPAVAALRRYLVPSARPTTPGVDVAVRLVAAEGLLAGDWYDVVTLSDQRWRITLVDVAGHGPDAGVLALRTKTFLEAAHALELDMGATLSWLGERLGDTGDQFVTALVIEIDAAKNSLRYASGGHPPMLLRPAEGPPVDLPPTGPLLGPLPGAWSTVTCRYDTGALLVAYTDGLTEARSRTGEQFGIERLSAVVEAHRTRTAEVIASATIDAVNDFAGPDTQDDITLVVVRRPSSAPH